MTIALNDRRARYVASAAQTSFDVDFPIDTDADVAVYHKVNATGVITLLTLTTDYTVTLDGSAPNTADVDLVVGAAVNDIITVEGETSPARDTDFTTGGDFFAGTVNNAEDRQYRIDQETKRDRDRTVVANRVSPDTFDPTLPDTVGAALLFLRINATETAFEYTSAVGPTGPAGADGADGADGDMTNPMTARGDIITGAAAGPGDPQRLGKGAADTVLTSDGTDPSWVSLPGTAREYTKTQNFNATTLTDGANISWDAEANQVCSVTLEGNRTLDAATNQVDGAFYSLAVIQDGTGSRTLSFASGPGYKFAGGSAPTVSTGANDRDEFVFKSDGTDMIEVGQQLDVS